MITKERQVPQVLELSSNGVTFPNVETALSHFKLGWGVEKHPLFTRIPSVDDPAHGIFKRADNLFGVVRSDTKATLGAVSGDYQTVDQVTALRPLDSLFAAGEFRIKRAGERFGGAQVWLEAAGPSITVAHHTVETGITVSFRHDGGGAVWYRGYFRRRSCFNELRAILGVLLKASGADGGGAGNVSLGFRHCAGAILEIANVPQHLERIGETRHAFVKTAETLLSQSFTRAEMEALVGELFPRPDATSTTRERRSWDDRFESIVEHAWGANDLADQRFTRWGALNAIADYEQHLVRVTGTPAQREERLMGRVIDDGTLLRKATAMLTA